MDKNFIKLIKEIPDFRRQHSIQYPLDFLLISVVLAILSNETIKAGIHRFCERHYVEICQCMKMPILERPPSEHVFRYLLKNINLNKAQLALNDNCELVHMDGKAVKGTLKNANNSEQSFLMIISAFSSELKQMIALKPFSTKESSEIAEMRNFFEDFKGKILTLDAGHWNKETPELIINSGNQYLIQVKKNRKKQFSQLKEIARSEKPFSIDIMRDKNKGRFEKRVCKVYSAENILFGSKLLVLVERTVNKIESEAFYLASYEGNAKKMNKSVREHWSVEVNHYERDVLLKEDACKIRNFDMAFALSWLRNLALNIVKSTPIKSFTQFVSSFSHNISALLNFF